MGTAFNGKALKDARLARGYTLIELSKMINVSKQAISQYEANINPPKAEVLMRIINTLKFPRYYFYSDMGNRFEGNTFFRANSSATNRLRDMQKIRANWIAHIRDYLEKFITFPELNLPDLSNYEDSIWDDVSIEHLAAHVRSYWGLSDKPITNLINVLEKNGIIVSSIKLDSDNVDAFCQFRQPDKAMIVLAEDKESAVRRQFDAAHELGHILMHKFDVDNQTELPKEQFKLMEAQADKFASCFLLTESTFRKSIEITSTTIQGFIELKKIWNVSIGAMVRRSRDLGLISESRYTSIQKQMSMKKMRKREPLDEIIEISEPNLLKRGIIMLIDAKVKTKADIVEEIMLPSEEIEILCSLDEKYLTVVEHEAVLSLKSNKDLSESVIG
ncbi:hypothetical protein BC351_10360 [Paenibacillus ferrarius]|uniref:HTH cro/C1-type domain-containing protein n=1 Tax=Paenibacillus ferrarius TaxID=1469647 RepID=A0A1V4H8P4_9BACL|nr:XRE family transcriptional regulator [Paenibacillus ferrarius]OPH47585.1 hypothetical protein BC351_10360 [Paenibacillus ferrarius]